jgi:hypothetical protein
MCSNAVPDRRGRRPYDKRQSEERPRQNAARSRCWRVREGKFKLFDEVMVLGSRLGIQEVLNIGCLEYLAQGYLGMSSGGRPAMLAQDAREHRETSEFEEDVAADRPGQRLDVVYVFVHEDGLNDGITVLVTARVRT